MLDIAFELVWITLFYSGWYKLIEHAFEHHVQTIKVAFNLDLRYHYLNRETDVDLRHEILHFFAASLSFVLLAINPTVRTLIYVLHAFIHVTEINRVLLYLTLLKMFRCIDPATLRFKISRKDVAHALLLLYVLNNFANSTVVIPVVFQLIDDAFDFIQWLTQFRETMAHVFTNVTEESYVALLNVIVAAHANAKIITNVRLGLLTAIVLYHILFSELELATDMPFYYYAIVRLTQIKQNTAK